LLTVEEGCDRLSVSRTTMFALLKAGDIRSVKVGRARRIVAESLHEFVAERLANAS
jgi:excisionase family DNA binding protein